MNLRTTLILVVLLVLGLGYVALQYTGWLDKDVTTDQAEDKRLTPEVAKVVRLTIKTPRAGEVVLVSDGDRWRLAEPVDAPAAQYEAGATVTDVTTLEHVRKYAGDDPDRPSEDLTRLADPVRIVTITDDKHKTYILRVGAKVPLEQRRTYVQLEGDKAVYVVDVDLAEKLAKTAADYRDKKLLDFATEKAVRVTVAGAKNYRLVKSDDRWAIDKPIDARADQAKVSSLLRDIAGLRAEKFDADAPTDLAGYGLANPVATVTVQLAAPQSDTQPTTAPASPVKGAPAKSLSIAFGSTADPKAETVFAKLGDKPWVFQISKSAIDRVSPKLLDLRDKAVLDLAGKQIAALESAFDAEPPMKLVKDPDGWKMVKPFAGPADAAAGELARTVRDLQANDFRDNPASFAAYKLEPPRGKIVLHIRGSGQTATLLLGGTSASGEMAFVRPAGAKFVAVIPADTFAKLLKGAREYWSREYANVPTDAEVIRVDLVKPNGAFTLTRDEDGQLALTAPAAAPIDTANAQAVVDALKAVRADKIAALAAVLPARFAEARPIKVTLTYRTVLPPEPTTTTAPTTATAPAEPKVRYKTHTVGPLLVIADRGHSYVWAEGASPVAVGELGADLHEKLAAELRDRQVLTVDADKVAEIKLTTGPSVLTLKKGDPRWTLAGDPHVRIDAGKVSEFLKGLDIKAQRFDDYTAKPNLKRFALDTPDTTLELTDADGKTVALKISRTGPVDTANRYATGGDVPGVFVLDQDALQRIRKTLQDFKE